MAALSLTTSKEFSLETVKHGLVEFSILSPWREQLILNSLENTKDIKDTDFSLIVAKYMLIKKDGCVFDEEYYKSIKSLDEIKLILNKDELYSFSNQFLSSNIPAFINENNSANNKKKNRHSQIKEYFVAIKDKFNVLVENATQLKYMNYDIGVIEKIKEMQKTVEMAIKASQGMQNPEFDQKFLLDYEKKSLEPDIKLKTLFSINNSFDKFLIKFDIFDNNTKGHLTLASKSINDIKKSQDKQIEQSNKTSRSAKIISIIAIIVSSLALISSIVFGIIQITLSKNSNNYVNEMNESISELNGTVLKLNETNSYYIEKIETLTTELTNLHKNEEVQFVLEE